MNPFFFAQTMDLDPNPISFPILSYVMDKLEPIIFTGDDIEHQVHRPEIEPHFDLSERMPRLNDPNVVSAMRLAVTEVAQHRSMLKTLGNRPDREIIDKAKLKLAEINANSLLNGSLSKDEIAEKETCKSLISLYELHEAYEKMLKEAEVKLQKIYDNAVAGGDVVTADHDENVKVAGVEDQVINDEVATILQEALGKDGIQMVDLSARMLKLLPEAFGRIRSLIVLNLTNNHLQVIPDSIAGLEKLEELYLSSNLLESLPDSIGLLVSLKILNVSSNKLTSLPESISHCRSLVELDASFNKLSYLPTSIGLEMVNMQRLSVPFNKLRTLPSSISEMKSLCVLDLHFNELNGLPRSIGNLTNLQTLNLSSNFSDLSELPDTIGDLKNLKELDLSNNQIHELPDSFGRLENLTKLNLDQNPLVIPPKKVAEGGAEAVKAFMITRRLEILMEAEKQSMEEDEEETLTKLFTRSTSWLTDIVAKVSGNVAEFLTGEKKQEPNHYLNQQF